MSSSYKNHTQAATAQFYLNIARDVLVRTSQPELRSQGNMQADKSLIRTRSAC